MSITRLLIELNTISAVLFCHSTLGTDLINGYMANYLLQSGCQLIQKPLNFGLRQIAAAVPLNVFYAQELSTLILSLVSTGQIQQIYSGYVI